MDYYLEMNLYQCGHNEAHLLNAQFRKVSIVGTIWNY